MDRVPVTVITGFLGSGKTTLLNRLLGASSGLRLAVVVNEFGAVGVDGALVAGGELFVELDNGCLCCALNQDLEELLHQLRARGNFDHLIIETTGLADPLGVAWTFERPGLSSYFRMDAIVTVVDAANIAQALDEFIEAQVQIERADLLLLNKLDLVSDNGSAAETRARSLNGLARVLRARHADVPWPVVLESGIGRASLPPAIAGRHSGFEAWVWQYDGLVRQEELEDLLYNLPQNVYRVKGILRAATESGWCVVHCVAGRFSMEPVAPSSPHRTCLVFIGRNLERRDLANLCGRLERD